MTEIENVVLEINKDDFISKEDQKPIFSRVLPKLNSVMAHLIPDTVILDQKRNLFDIDLVCTHFKHQGRLSLKQVAKLIEDSIRVLSEEPNCVELDSGAYAVGDIHGQFYDMLTILKKVNYKNNKVVFLGDYVDRGAFGCEVYLFLLLLKCHYPKQIYLLRGNHESKSMTSYFTFKKEVTKKYDESIYEMLLQTFNNLPLCAVIQKSAFCVHGGISSKISKLENINKNFKRFKEASADGIMCDLLWADPNPAYESEFSTSFAFNGQRNCSKYYNYNDVKHFLDKHELKCIIRGHEVKDEGYEFYRNYKNHPSVVTIFSAPNYCDTYKNIGAILYYDNQVEKVIQYENVAHPFVLPGFLDGISWSFPFIFEKIVEFSLSFFKDLEILKARTTSSSSGSIIDLEKTCTLKDELSSPMLSFEPTVSEKLLTALALMRTERESIEEFIYEESTMVDPCVLQTGLNEDIETFEDAIEKDKVNEEKKDDEDSDVIEELKNVSPSLLPSTLKNANSVDEIDVLKSKVVEEIIPNKYGSTQTVDSMDLDLQKNLDASVESTFDDVVFPETNSFDANLKVKFPKSEKEVKDEPADVLIWN